MERFPFEPADDGQTAAQPHVSIAVVFRGHTDTIRALYDTGSDITHLSQKWKHAFHVDDSLVPKLPVGGLGKELVYGSLVFVTARMDGHDFNMPVVFHSDNTTDLFGRHGLGELFLIETDSLLGETRVTWQQDVETSADRMKKDVLAVAGNFLPGWDIAPGPA